MSIPVYDLTAPRFIHMLNGMAHVLKKSAENMVAREVDEQVFIGARLAPEMHPLPNQVYIATDLAKACVSRLAGVEAPVYEDTESTFEELQARIAKTIAYLKTFDAEQLNGTQDKMITLSIAGNEMEMSGAAYVLNFVYPNFLFHCTTAYALMRSQGVPLGKFDFFGGALS